MDKRELEKAIAEGKATFQDKEQAIKDGTATVNEICDMEEAAPATPETVRLNLTDLLEAGLLEKDARPTLSELLNSGNKGIQALGREIAAAIKNLDKTFQQLSRLVPYVNLLKREYPEENPLWDEHISMVANAANVFVIDRELEGASPERIEQESGNFLAFFKAYYAEWLVLKERYGKDLDMERAHSAIWEYLTDKGLLKGNQTKAIQQSLITAIAAAAGYGFISQGSAVHELMRTRARQGKIDSTTGTERISEGELLMLIENSVKGGLKDTTKRFLLAMLYEGTRQSWRKDQIDMPLRAYADLCGLSDLKAARQQVTEDMETLYRVSISRNSEGKKRGGDFSDARICSYQAIKNGIISFQFGQKFYDAAKVWSRLPYPVSAFKLNLKHNPHGQNIMLTLARHKYMNKGGPSENRISVDALLAACPGIPRYSELDESKQLSKRIIDPFERDLNELANLGAIKTWEYCHSLGRPLSDEELAQGMTYERFSSLYITFELRDGYPDQTKRLAAKGKHRQAAAKKKAAARKKKAAETEQGGVTGRPRGGNG